MSSSAAQATSVLDLRGATRGASERGAAEEEASRHGDTLIDDDALVSFAGLEASDADAKCGEKAADSIADVTGKAPRLDGCSKVARSVQRESATRLEHKESKEVSRRLVKVVDLENFTPQ